MSASTTQVLENLNKVLRRNLGQLIEGRLQCPSCGVEADVKNKIELSSVEPDGFSGTRFYVSVKQCPSCLQTSAFVICAIWDFQKGEWVEEWNVRAYPRGGRHIKSFPNTPDSLAKHYKAACNTVEVSAAAAATMARRCLEELLHNQGYTQFNIGEKIKALLNETDSKKHLPLALHQCVDQIRTYGNFSTHPLTDRTSLEIVEVEPGEAEWCIEILEGLFDHYFERPAEMAKRISAANAKLQSVGKPPARI